MHILVVEDEKARCDTIARSLRRLAYSVDCCYDGQSAAEMLAVERFDLVVLDLNLPGEDGMTVLRTLRERDRDTKVLILSARCEVADKVAGLDAGANDYLTKPFHLDELAARIRSLPLEEMARQAAHLAAEGYRELVLTGIEIASYGRDLPGKLTLADAVETVAAAAPQMRLRLGSIEPTVITEDFCRRAAATGQVCRHFHLSLQSGCDRTLARMNRKYNTAEFLACVERLRRYFPGCALTADMITGFPGETEADQAAAVAFLEQVGFAAVHVFPYSRRPGTKADAMPEQLSHAVKSARAHEAQRVADACKQRYLVQQVGQTLPVLFETEHDGSWVGHSDNYCLVRAAGDDLRGLVKNVKIHTMS